VTRIALTSLTALALVSALGTTALAQTPVTKYVRYTHGGQSAYASWRERPSASSAVAVCWRPPDREDREVVGSQAPCAVASPRR